MIREWGFILVVLGFFFAYYKAAARRTEPPRKGPTRGFWSGKK